jgi:hypothetical protein
MGPPKKEREVLYYFVFKMEIVFLYWNNVAPSVLRGNDFFCAFPGASRGAGFDQRG